MTEQPNIFEVQLLIKFKAARSKPKRRKLLLAKRYGYERFAVEKLKGAWCSISCEAQTYFQSSLLSLRELKQRRF